MRLPVNPLASDTTISNDHQHHESSQSPPHIRSQEENERSATTDPSDNSLGLLLESRENPTQKIVLPHHPAFLPAMVVFENGKVPIIKIPSFLLDQRNFVLRWLQFTLMETVASLSFGFMKRGIAKTSLALNALLILISCYGLYANLTFQILHIAIHAMTLFSVCLLFTLYILIIAFVGDESWWLLFIIFGFVSFDFYSGYIAIAYSKALVKFDKELTSHPELTEQWVAPTLQVSHSWWTDPDFFRRRREMGGDVEVGGAGGANEGAGGGRGGGGGGNRSNSGAQVSDRTFQIQAILSRKQEIESLDLSDAPEDFKCPISMEVMADPVVAQDGFSYERDNIVKWFTKNSISPVTRAKVKKQVFPNQALKSQILTFIETRKEVERRRTQRSASTVSISGINISSTGDAD